jgi:hypothetical protein
MNMTYDIIHTSTSMVAIVTILSFAEIMRDSISMALIDVQTQQQQHKAIISVYELLNYKNRRKRDEYIIRKAIKNC